MEQLRQRGLVCRVVGGAGTGTFALEAASGIWNEIQAGSFCFMDADYARNLEADGSPVSTFRHALFVLATVISTPRPGLAVLDVGHKGVAVDCGLPLVWQMPDVRYVGASDEHGKLVWEGGDRRLAIGQKLRLIPGHCDPTVDRYDWYVGVRGAGGERLSRRCPRRDALTAGGAGLFCSSAAWAWARRNASGGIAVQACLRRARSEHARCASAAVRFVTWARNSVRPERVRTGVTVLSARAMPIWRSAFRAAESAWARVEKAPTCTAQSVTGPWRPRVAWRSALCIAARSG